MLDILTFLRQGKVKYRRHNIYELVIMTVTPHFKIFFEHGSSFLRDAFVLTLILFKHFN